LKDEIGDNLSAILQPAFAKASAGAVRHSFSDGGQVQNERDEEFYIAREKHLSFRIKLLKKKPRLKSWLFLNNYY